MKILAMSEMWGWSAKSLAVRLAMLFLIAGAYFGSSRSLGAFLFSIPILALMLLGALVATARASLRRVERPCAILACTLICLTPIAYHFSYGLVQRIDFLLWAPSHYRKLAQASKKDGIVMGWDSWGMAGQDTFSYLVADTEDRLGSKERADEWTKQIGQSCALWEAQRMWAKLYIVTTYTNCPYDGVEPAN
jgi:hypothetical protein